MACGRRQLFIYYRLTPGEEAVTVRRLIQAQHALMDDLAGLHASLLRRPPMPGLPITLMEAYAMDAGIDPEGVSPQTQLLIEQTIATHLGSGIDGLRHVEVFEACV